MGSGRMSSFAGLRCGVGTSFVEFNGHGFWTRDPLVEALLGGIVVELEDLALEHGWLPVALDHWALQATAGFQGCISPKLDWLLAEPDRAAIVVAASRRYAVRIEGDAVHEVSSEAFERRAARVLGKPWEEPPGALGALLRRVHEAFQALVEGRLTAPPESALFVWETSYYLNKPPELEARRWTLAADRSDPEDDAALDELGGALPEAWRPSMLRAEGPALAKIDVQWSGAPWTVVVSRRGRLVTASSPTLPTWALLRESGLVRALSNLSSQGFRWVPSDLLREPYDGVDPSLREAGISWAQRLFGQL
jgi:hypothetical protein